MKIDDSFRPLFDPGANNALFGRLLYGKAPFFDLPIWRKTDDPTAHFGHFLRFGPSRYIWDKDREEALIREQLRFWNNGEQIIERADYDAALIGEAIQWILGRCIIDGNSKVSQNNMDGLQMLITENAIDCTGLSAGEISSLIDRAAQAIKIDGAQTKVAILSSIPSAAIRCSADALRISHNCPLYERPDGSAVTDIYILAMSSDDEQLVYGEYLPIKKPSRDADEHRITDDGLFVFYKQTDLSDFRHCAECRIRLVAERTELHTRLHNVDYGAFAE